MSDGDKAGTETDALADFETSAFESLEKDFQEVLSELVGDKSLDKFRLEYEKLHRALKKSHDQEKRLIQKCRVLNTEIVNNAAKVQTALKLSQEDQTTIGSLKKEIEKAWKMVDASHDKEVAAKDTIQDLKDEIISLSLLVEQGAGLTLGQEGAMQELTREKEELERINQEYEKKQEEFKARIDENLLYIEKLNKEKESIAEKNQNLSDSLETKSAEHDREQRRKERIEKEMKDLKLRLEGKEAQLEDSQISMREGQEQNQKHLSDLREARNAMEKHLRDQDALLQRTAKLNDDVEKHTVNGQQLAIENNCLKEDAKRNNIEVTKMSNECEMLKRKVDKEKKLTLQLRQIIEDRKAEHSNLESQVLQLNKDLHHAVKQEDVKAKDVDSLKRAAELSEKLISRESQKVKHVTKQVQLTELASKNLETEIYSFKQEASKQRKLIYQLEKDREKYGLEASEAHAKYIQALDQVKLKEMLLAETQKKVLEGEGKLKQQQQLYEAVRSDRNLYSKNLIENQDEIAEMKRKFKIMNHQIEQLKEEITAKDHALVKEHFEHQKVDKQKDQLKNELSKMKSLLDSNEQTITSQNTEVLKLAHMIQKMDDEALRQRKEYDQAINERDILGTQLIRRNDELALLYEKIKIQQSTLRNGETQYKERVEDIRIMKLKIGDLKRELQVSKYSGTNVDDLKREVFSMQRDLLQEKTKVKALSEELENPMNVHRWRKLEGSDPATYEMIQKIQTLQRRLISKTEQVVEKDLLIQEKEKLYHELKTILARQPGPEVAEQLNVYQQTLKEKTRQMKAMASELNMHQAQVNEYKYEIERVTRDLQDMKRKYYVHKREKQSRNTCESTNQEKETKSSMAIENGSPEKRIAGGGFYLK